MFAEQNQCQNNTNSQQSEEQKYAEIMKVYNEVYYNRWVEPNTGSSCPYAIQVIDKTPVPFNPDNAFDSLKTRYKKVERKNNKPFVVKYQSQTSSGLWELCPHCGRQNSTYVLLDCYYCKNKLSYMVELSPTGNKIASHVIGCKTCPERFNNMLLDLKLNEQEYCFECFNSKN